MSCFRKHHFCTGASVNSLQCNTPTRERPRNAHRAPLSHGSAPGPANFPAGAPRSHGSACELPTVHHSHARASAQCPPSTTLAQEHPWGRELSCTRTTLARERPRSATKLSRMKLAVRKLMKISARLAREAPRPDGSTICEPNVPNSGLKIRTTLARGAPANFSCAQNLHRAPTGTPKYAEKPAPPASKCSIPMKN